MAPSRIQTPDPDIVLLPHSTRGSPHLSPAYSIRVRQLTYPHISELKVASLLRVGAPRCSQGWGRASRGLEAVSTLGDVHWSLGAPAHASSLAEAAQQAGPQMGGSRGAQALELTGERHAEPARCRPGRWPRASATRQARPERRGRALCRPGRGVLPG